MRSDEALAAWEAEHSRRIWGTKPDPRLMEFIARTYPQSLNERFFGMSHVAVLDVGCGSGQNAAWMARRGFSVNAFDASKSAIGRAKYLHPGSACFWTGIATDIPIADSHVDLVTDIACLQHLPIENAKKALSEIARVLKPTGILLSITASEKCDPAVSYVSPMRRMGKAEAETFYLSEFRHLAGKRAAHIDGRGHRAEFWVTEARLPRRLWQPSLDDMARTSILAD